MSLFTNLDTISADDKSEFFSAGDYETELVSASYKPSKDPKKPRDTTIFKAVFRLLASGSMRTWILPIPPEAFNPKNHERKMRDVKGLLLAVAGVHPADERAVADLAAGLAERKSSFADLAEQLTSEGAPFAGRRVRVCARDITTKAGAAFVALSFEPGAA